MAHPHLPVTEQTFLFGDAKSLVGIVTDPATGNGRAERPAALLLNAGLTYRVGPNRLYVKIARALASQGLVTLRFDLSGIGDSRARDDDVPLEQRAIDWMYGTWLPRARYVPDDQPAFEAWVGRPFAHGLEHFELDMHLPVRAF